MEPGQTISVLNYRAHERRGHWLSLRGVRTLCGIVAFSEIVLLVVAAIWMLGVSPVLPRVTTFRLTPLQAGTSVDMVNTLATMEGLNGQEFQLTTDFLNAGAGTIAGDEKGTSFRGEDWQQYIRIEGHNVDGIVKRFHLTQGTLDVSVKELRYRPKHDRWHISADIRHNDGNTFVHSNWIDLKRLPAGITSLQVQHDSTWRGSRISPALHGLRMPKTLLAAIWALLLVGLGLVSLCFAVNTTRWVAQLLVWLVLWAIGLTAVWLVASRHVEQPIWFVDLLRPSTLPFDLLPVLLTVVAGAWGLVIGMALYIRTAMYDRQWSPASNN